MFQGGFVSWFLFYSVTTVIVFTALVAFFPLQVKKIERIVHQQSIRVGEQVEVTIILYKRRLQPFFFVRIEDDIPARLGKAKGSALFFFSFQPQLVYSYTIDGAKRGIHNFNTVTLVFSDLFGWMERRIHVACKTTVYVYPNVHKLGSIPMSKGMKEFEDQQRHSFDQTGHSIAGVRQYIPGDRITSIDWKQSARSTRLMTKEFESFQGEEVIIAFDPYLSAPQAAYFEKVVELAASLIAALIEQKSLIHLAVRSKGWMMAPVTMRTLTKGLKLLAQVQPATRPIESIHSIYHEWSASQVYLVCAELNEHLVKACMTMLQQQIDVTIYLLAHGEYIHDPSIVRELEKKEIDIYRIAID